MHSSSNVTCWFRISATLCGTLNSGSGTTPVLRDQPPLRRPYHWQELHAVLHRRPEPFPGLSTTAQTQTVHLVGPRRGLFSVLYARSTPWFPSVRQASDNPVQGHCPDYRRAVNWRRSAPLPYCVTF